MEGAGALHGGAKLYRLPPPGPRLRAPERKLDGGGHRAERGGRGVVKEIDPRPYPPPQGGWEFNLARTRTADRTHASAAGPLRRDGLAHSRRRDLRHRVTQGRTQGWINAAFACAGGRRPAVQKPPADPGRRPDPRAYPRGAQPMWLARGSEPGHAAGFS